MRIRDMILWIVNVIFPYKFDTRQPLHILTDVCVFDSEIHRMEMEQEQDVKPDWSRPILSAFTSNHTDPPPKVLHAPCKLSLHLQSDKLGCEIQNGQACWVKDQIQSCGVTESFKCRVKLRPWLCGCVTNLLQPPELSVKIPADF